MAKKRKQSLPLNTMFDDAMLANILQRIHSLQPDSPRLWGSMDVAQMLKHCTVPFEIPLGKAKAKRTLMGYVMGGFVKKMVTDPKPYRHNMPTDKSFVVKDHPEFEAQKAALLAKIDAFIHMPKEKLSKAVHPFFGRLTARQWGAAMWKHLDHHLRQFGA